MFERNRRPVLTIALGIFLALVMYFSIVAWNGLFLPKEKAVVDSGFHEIMGTFARIVAVAADEEAGQKCIEAGFEQFRRVDDSMSDYKAESELSSVNRQGYKSEVGVSEQLFEVLEISEKFSKLSGGAFDITVGPLVDLFHSAEKTQVAPTDEQIAGTKSKVGFEKLKLDRQNRTVKFAVDGMRLDLGAIGKGYAVDKAVEAMRKSGAAGGMVDLGGNIRCFGAPPAGEKYWRVGLQDPNNAGAGISVAAPLLVLKLTEEGVSTSGNYQRFITIKGKKYNHIFNPQTGYDSEGLSSVTIIDPNATDADALSTAVTVMGIERGLALVESMPETEAILISAGPEFKITKTKGAEKYIESQPPR